MTEREFERQVWGPNVNDDTKLELRLWASYRGQTLARTGIITPLYLRSCGVFSVFCSLNNCGTKPLLCVKFETFLQHRSCTMYSIRQCSLFIRCLMNQGKDKSLVFWCSNLYSALVSGSHILQLNVLQQIAVFAVNSEIT